MRRVCVSKQLEPFGIGVQNEGIGQSYILLRNPAKDTRILLSEREVVAFAKQRNGSSLRDSLSSIDLF